MAPYPGTLSELANAYYNDWKTTIEAGEPLAKILQQAQKLPYFVTAGPVYGQNNDLIARNFDFKPASDANPYEIGLNLMKFRDLLDFLGQQQNLDLDISDLIQTPDGEIRLSLGLASGSPSPDFESFTKGLGILLRAATQHKREEAYAAPQPNSI